MPARPIEDQIISGKIDLPDGRHITLRQPVEMTGRHRREIELLAARLGPIASEMDTAGRILVDGDVVEDRRDELEPKTGRPRFPGPDLNLTERQWRLTYDMNLATTWALLKSWSLPDPLPARPDDLLDLDPVLYETITSAAQLIMLRVTEGGAAANAPGPPRRGKKPPPRKAAAKKPARRAPRPKAATSIDVAPEPRIIVGYTNLHPDTERLLREHAPGFIAVPIDPADDDAYWRLLADEWQRPGDLIVIEQDIGIHAGVVEEFTQCREAWCGHPYWAGKTTAAIALGCTRFTADLKAAEPDLFEVVGRASIPGARPRNWRFLDARLFRELRHRGYEPHKHTLQVEHYNLHTDTELHDRIVDGLTAPTSS
jgi:hypothetical protein